MMAYPQFGYTACPTAASSLASSQLLSMSAGSTPQTTVSTSCCESGRPIMTDPTTGQTVCSCQYSSAASSLLSYPARMAGLSESVYNSYAAQGYVPFGADPSAFYSPLNSAYDLKDGADAWRSLAHPTPCYPYDPTGMGGYPYGQSALAQRKNATREATSTLKAWLQEHIKNPYPTKGEKIMLAIITKMTLTQVSTWFANARRRLKKENKMTWSPRNRSDEDGNKLDSDDDDDDDKKDDDKKDGEKKDKDDDDIDINIDGGDELNICGDDDDDFGLKDADKLKNQCRLAGLPPHSSTLSVLSSSTSSASTSSSCMSTTADPNNPSKPRIWSLADVATSTSPSTGGNIQQQPTHQRSNGIHVGHPSGLRGPHTQLPPHHLGAHHPSLSTSPKSDTNSQYHPAVNGFRPWVNGASYTSGPSGPASAQPPSGLLRPYPVAPRTEVH